MVTPTDMATNAYHTETADVTRLIQSARKTRQPTEHHANETIILTNFRHSKTVLANLYNQYKEGRNCDLELRFPNRESLYVHKCLIDIYMHTVGAELDDKEDRFYIQMDYSFDIVSRLVMRIYTGMLKILPTNVEELRYVASSLGFEDAAQACRKFILSETHYKPARPALPVTQVVTMTLSVSRGPAQAVATTSSVSLRPARQVTQTVTMMPSVSIRPTQPVTQAVTMTPSVSLRPTHPVTQAVTMTPSVSLRPAQPVTQTVTMTPSVSLRPTQPVTQTVTMTPSVSLRPTRPVTQTVTMTPSVSLRPSHPVTQTVTMTPSVSLRPSHPVTQTVTMTPSVSLRPSHPVTQTVTMTPSVSLRPTRPVTQTVTMTPSVSLRPSHPVTQTVTMTPSVSLRPSHPVTQTVTMTPSVSLRPTQPVTQAVTMTPSVSLRPSHPVTQTVTTMSSVSRRPSHSVTQAVTTTPSVSRRPTKPVTQTPTKTDIYIEDDDQKSLGDQEISDADQCPDDQVSQETLNSQEASELEPHHSLLDTPGATDTQSNVSRPLSVENIVKIYPQPAVPARNAQCCIPNCEGEHGDRLHRFPNNMRYFRSWIQAITANIGKHVILSEKGICSKHFLPSDYKYSFGRLVLRAKAKPSVFNIVPADQATSGQGTLATAKSGQEKLRSAKSGQAKLSCAKSGQGKLSGAKSGQEKMRSAKSGQAKLRSAKTGQTKVSSTKSGQGKLSSAKSGQGKLSSAKSGQGKLSSAKSGQAKLRSAKSGQAKLSSAKSGQGKLSSAKSGKGKLSSAKSGQAKLSSAKSGQAKLSSAKSGHGNSGPGQDMHLDIGINIEKSCEQSPNVKIVRALRIQKVLPCGLLVDVADKTSNKSCAEKTGTPKAATKVGSDKTDTTIESTCSPNDPTTSREKAKETSVLPEPGIGPQNDVTCIKKEAVSCSPNDSTPSREKAKETPSIVINRVDTNIPVRIKQEPEDNEFHGSNITTPAASTDSRAPGSRDTGQQQERVVKVKTEPGVVVTSSGNTDDASQGALLNTPLTTVTSSTPETLSCAVNRTVTSVPKVQDMTSIASPRATGYTPVASNSNPVENSHTTSPESSSNTCQLRQSPRVVQVVMNKESISKLKNLPGQSSPCRKQVLMKKDSVSKLKNLQKAVLKSNSTRTKPVENIITGSPCQSKTGSLNMPLDKNWKIKGIKKKGGRYPGFYAEFEVAVDSDNAADEPVVYVEDGETGDEYNLAARNTTPETPLQNKPKAKAVALKGTKAVVLTPKTVTEIRNKVVAFKPKPASEIRNKAVLKPGTVTEIRNKSGIDMEEVFWECVAHAPDGAHKTVRSSSPSTSGQATGGSTSTHTAAMDDENLHMGQKTDGNRITPSTKKPGVFRATYSRTKGWSDISQVIENKNQDETKKPGGSSSIHSTSTVSEVTGYEQESVLVSDASSEDGESLQDQESQMFSLGLKRKAEHMVAIEGAGTDESSKQAGSCRRLRKRKKVAYSKLETSDSEEEEGIDMVIEGSNQPVTKKRSLTQPGVIDKPGRSRRFPHSSEDSWPRQWAKEAEDTEVTLDYKRYFKPAAIVPKGCNSSYAKGVIAKPRMVTSSLTDRFGNKRVETKVFPKRKNLKYLQQPANMMTKSNIFICEPIINPSQAYTPTIQEQKKVGKTTVVVCHPTKPVVNVNYGRHKWEEDHSSTPGPLNYGTYRQ